MKDTHFSRREALRLAAATALGSAVSSAQSARVFDARDTGAVGDGGVREAGRQSHSRGLVAPSRSAQYGKGESGPPS